MWAAGRPINYSPPENNNPSVARFLLGRAHKGNFASALASLLLPAASFCSEHILSGALALPSNNNHILHSPTDGSNKNTIAAGTHNMLCCFSQRRMCCCFFTGRFVSCDISSTGWKLTHAPATKSRFLLRELFRRRFCSAIIWSSTLAHVPTRVLFTFALRVLGTKKPCFSLQAKFMNLCAAGCLKSGGGIHFSSSRRCSA